LREDHSGAPGANRFVSRALVACVAAGAVLLVVALASTGRLSGRWAALLLLASVTAGLSAHVSIPPRGFTWSTRRVRQAAALTAATFVVALLPATAAIVAADPVATKIVARPGDRVQIPRGWSHARLRLRNPSPGHDVYVALGGAWPTVAAHLLRDHREEREHAHVDFEKPWRMFDVSVEGATPELVVVAIDGGQDGRVEVKVYPPTVPPTWSVLAAALVLIVVACVLSARAPLGEIAVSAVVAAVACGLALRQAALAEELDLVGVLITLLGTILGGGLVGLMLSSATGVMLRRTRAERLKIRRR
jgi:hypothetical protein